MSDIPHYKVALATPGHSMKAEYVASMIDTCRELASNGYTFTFLNKYSSFVPSARELTLTDTYSHDWKTNQVGSGKFTCDSVLWIDSDIEWRPDDVFRLLDSTKDIISGLYQLNPSGRVAVNIHDNEGRATVVNKVEFLLHDDPVEVDGVGFGFVAIKSKVFEVVPRPWFLIDRARLEGIDFDINVGEDYSFCNNAKKAGFKIWIDPKVKVKHHKETVFAIE
jgi:hypothetical protein